MARKVSGREPVPGPAQWATGHLELGSTVLGTGILAAGATLAAPAGGS